MRFKTNEQETVIIYDAAIGKWSFYSCVPSHVRMFLKSPFVQENVEILTEDKGQPTSIKFDLEKSLVVTRRIIKQKQERELSDAQRKALEKGRQALKTVTKL